MALVRRGGLADFNSMLSDFFEAENFFPGNSRFKASLPAVNVMEKNDHYEIEVAAPGMKKEDFDIAIHNGVLTLKAERKQESAREKENFTRREYIFSSFERNFSLPDDVVEEDIKASYNDGLLNIALTKADHAVDKGPRKVSVD